MVPQNDFVENSDGARTTWSWVQLNVPRFEDRLFWTNLPNIEARTFRHSKFMSLRGLWGPRSVCLCTQLPGTIFISARSNDLPVGQLSGGEQARLPWIAQMMLQTSSSACSWWTQWMIWMLKHWMFCKNLLDQFHGAIILVSHDRYFMDQLWMSYGHFQFQNWRSLSYSTICRLQTQWESWFPNGFHQKSGSAGKRKLQLPRKRRILLQNLPVQIHQKIPVAN